MGKKIIIQTEEKNIDVTNKMAIIYGAGQGCIDLMNEIELPNVKHVIDSNSDLWGKKLVLLGRIFEIESPQKLSELIDCDNYYITVSSIKYFNSIFECLKMLHVNIDICRWDKIKYYYNNIEDMIYLDPIIGKKMMLRSIKSETYNLITKYYFIEKNFLKGVDVNTFIPISNGGSKISFYFGNNNNKYYFGYRGLVNSKNPRYIIRSNVENIILRNNFINSANLDKDMTIYRDEFITVQKYAISNLKINDEILVKIIKKCRELHSKNCDLKKLPQKDVIKEYYEIIKTINEKEKIENDLKIIDSLIKKEVFINKQNNVIHGDLLIDNIVIYNNNINFIDWEDLSIGDPLLDISYLIYSFFYCDYYVKKEGSFSDILEKSFNKVEKIVHLYLKENSKENILKNSLYKTYLFMVILSVKDILIFYENNIDEIKKRLNIIIQIIEIYFEN